LLLQGAEGSEVSLRLDQLLDGRAAERADQLFLEVGAADEEPEPLQIGPEPGAFERAPELALLCRVAETCEPEVESAGPETIDESPDRLCAADRHDGYAFGNEVTAATHGERLERTLIARPFDEHDCAQLVHVAYLHSE
jgi:hypothetical protein